MYAGRVVCCSPCQSLVSHVEFALSVKVRQYKKDEGGMQVWWCCGREAPYVASFMCLAKRSIPKPETFAAIWLAVAEWLVITDSLNLDYFLVHGGY